MQCWVCEEAARGVCKFCGRGVCKEHAATRAAILTVYNGKDQTPKAVVVADALFCGQCKPVPDPVPMPEIY